MQNIKVKDTKVCVYIYIYILLFLYKENLKLYRISLQKVTYVCGREKLTEDAPKQGEACKKNS